VKDLLIHAAKGLSNGLLGLFNLRIVRVAQPDASALVNVELSTLIFVTQA
jgi:hypothetical protein